jgi:hypothetical protein
MYVWLIIVFSHSPFLLCFELETNKLPLVHCKSNVIRIVKRQNSLTTQITVPRYKRLCRLCVCVCVCVYMLQVYHICDYTKFFLRIWAWSVLWVLCKAEIPKIKSPWWCKYTDPCAHLTQLKDWKRKVVFKVNNRYTSLCIKAKWVHCSVGAIIGLHAANDVHSVACSPLLMGVGGGGVE